MRWIKIVQNHDMRQRHGLRNSRAALLLKPGQCIIAINRRRSIGRIIDCVGAIYDYYEEPGRAIDVQRLKEMVREGWGVELTGKGIKLLKAG